MKRALLLLTAVVVSLSGFSAAQDVRYNFDRNKDFSKFKTYKWVEIKGATSPSDLLDKQIKESFDAQLATKGLTKVDSDTADLYIGYQLAIDKQTEFTSYSSGWGYGPGWYGGGWYGSPNSSTFTSGQTNTIYVGQLAIDMYDSANHELVWRGLGIKTIDTKAKPDKQQKNLTKAVMKMLKNYPPPVKK